MSDAVTPGTSPPPSPGGVVIGFYGKLPARGDFVRAGLPRDFTDPWDAWLQSVIAGSRTVLGVMLPSVDRAGRYFPLTFAALSAHGIAMSSGEAWLDACEAAGRNALEQDTPPQEIADMVGSIDLAEEAEGFSDATWWSEGSPRVSAARLTLRRLPDAATYAAMLGAEQKGTDVAPDEFGQEERKWESPP
jgi:type VI secretion system protein ImpM